MEQSKKNKIWVFTFFGSAVLLMLLFNNRQYPIDLEKFHNKELKGIVTYVFSSSGGTRISLNNSSEKHVVYTKYNEKVESFFYRFIVIGDSIYKAPNDNYIRVFKGENEFLFETIKE